MNRLKFAILFSSVYVIIYHACPFIGLPGEMTVALFAVSPLVVIYLVYIVLRFGNPSPYTFEERFYDDHEYQRNGEEDLRGS